MCGGSLQLSISLTIREAFVSVEGSVLPTECLHALGDKTTVISCYQQILPTVICSNRDFMHFNRLICTF